MEAKMAKVNDFFGLWCSIMNAGGERADDDRLGMLLDRIFQEEYRDGHEALKWFEHEFSKVKDPTLRRSLRNAVENLVSKNQYLHLAAGFALGGLYDAIEPKAQSQIEYLRKEIHDGGVFPMAAKLNA